MAVDNLFTHEWGAGSFSFDAAVTEVFDDMVVRSIPGYRDQQSLLAGLALRLGHGGPIYDLGCSTGNTIQAIAEQAELPVSIVGYDQSPSMTESCRQKIDRQFIPDNCTIIVECRDIFEENLFSHGRPTVVILSLVLQFVRPIVRREMIKKISEGLGESGCLLVVEKISHQDRYLNSLFVDVYHRFKVEQGYTEAEISSKRMAIENYLIPFQMGENFTLLKEHFSSVATFYQYLNFVGYVAIK